MKETKRQNKTKRQLPEWEKVFVNDTPEMRLTSKIYKALTQLNKQKNKTNPQTIQFKMDSEDMNRHFSKEEIQKVNRHIKR